MKEHVTEKYKTLLQLFLDYIRREHQFFLANYKAPPIPEGCTAVGGAIAWASIMRTNVHSYMQFFKRVYIYTPTDDTGALLTTNMDIDMAEPPEMTQNQPPPEYSTIL
jgi:hypothetical protein